MQFAAILSAPIHPVAVALPMWQVLIVEDDHVTREFFARCVLGCAQLVLVEAVATVQDACAVLDAQGGRVDVLLTDLGLPDGSGLDVIRHALRCNPAVEPLVVSMFGDDENVLAAIEAGALGYIHKDSTPEDVAQAILDMRDGASPISPMIARRVLAKYRVQAVSVPLARVSSVQSATEIIANDALPNDPLLTPREQQVLSLIARGFSYAEIARLEGLSVHTVQTHIKRLYAKLSVHSKTEAIYEASRMGLLREGG
jgi:DNA-binding NarL/FixJ family response regulator